MFKIKRRRRKNSPFEFYYEPECTCKHCGKTHLMSERIRHVPEDTSKYLCIYLCPKCNGKSYLVGGDVELRRRKT